MVADLALPRSAWADHPHWPQQILLLGSHDNFRRISKLLVREAEEGGSRRILETFSWWKSAMRNHERYEEFKLYPYLRHRFGIEVSQMETGHHELAVEDAAVRAASLSGQAQFTDALSRHDRVLHDHLALEEEVVIPALLALAPNAFEEYCEHSLSWLLNTHPAGSDQLY